ncbi:T9SS type A sorting domain-containing protein [Tunicatimonas pelagia]|uniref:T9SS type A sorting domain-containing protein n=1 Tax=Tunicatimonas pelagia TaxID=931531 RepID=UPI002667164C|nr:T9SS type A sorting domain-containing protein [Tunicatimonas pelagia]WKN40697.1 T9SS type A sorting domain-containing protein [Tunicatimonas pelagia]
MVTTMKYTIVLLTLLSCMVEVAFAQSNARYMPSSDPNLDPNWQWYKSYASQGGLDMWYRCEKATDCQGQSIGKVGNGVETPFFTSGHPLRTYDNEKDMYPEDGWMLAYRDFGTSTSAPNVPFFILYNRYRGVLRLLFRNIDQLSYSSMEASLQFLATTRTSALLAFNDDNAPCLNGYDPAIIQTYISKVAVYDGWGYADFNLFNYDPGLDRNIELRLAVNGVDLSTIKVNGDLSLNQVMDENVGTTQGSDFAKAFNTGTKYVKRAGDGVKKLKELVKDKNDDDAWWVPAIKQISGAAGFLPGAGQVLGLVSSLIFQDDAASPKPLNFKGDLAIEGTIENRKELFRLGLKLNHNAPTSSEYYRPVQYIPWGVFSLVEKPVIGTEACFIEGPSDSRGKCGFSLMNELKYTFNDNTGLSLVSMKAAFTFEDREPTGFYNIAMIENAGFFSGYRNPNGLALELKLRIKNSTRNTNRDITVYRVYPIQKEPRVPRNMKTMVGIDFDFRNNYYPFSANGHISPQTIVANNRIVAGQSFQVRYPYDDLEMIAGQEIVFTSGFEVILDEYNQDVEFIAVVPDFRDNEVARTNRNLLADVTFSQYLAPLSEKENKQVLTSRNVTNEYMANSNWVTEDKPGKEVNDAFNVTCFPNAFSESLTVRTQLRFPATVKVEIYDSQGMLVHTTVSDKVTNNGFETVWYPEGTTKSGIYFVKVSTDNKIVTQKVVLNR